MSGRSSFLQILIFFQKNKKVVDNATQIVINYPHSVCERADWLHYSGVAQR